MSLQFRWGYEPTVRTESALHVALQDFLGFSTQPIKTSKSHLEHEWREDIIREINHEDASTLPNTTTTSTCHSPLLLRPLSRIPGYIEDCPSDAFYGYVMRDFSNRFLDGSKLTATDKRVIAIVANNAKKAEQEIQNHLRRKPSPYSREDAMAILRYRIGESFLVDALWNDHAVVAVDPDVRVNHDSYNGTIFLLVLDPQWIGHEDFVADVASRWIASDSTRFALFRISSSNHRMHGLNACQQFWDAGYKLQILSSSHVPDGLNTYPPNMLLKSREQVQEYLKHGEQLANNNKRIKEPVFQSYLFATRGWELAIPSRKEYLNMTRLGNDHVIDVQHEGVPFRRCPGVSEEEASIKLGKQHYDISCFGKPVSIPALGNENNFHYKTNDAFISAEMWMGHHNTSLSEAACVKCTMYKPNQSSWVQKTACTTRSLSNSGRMEKRNKAKSIKVSEKVNQDFNLLAIHIEGLSRKKIVRSLPSLKHIFSQPSLRFHVFPDFGGKQNEPLAFGEVKIEDLPYLFSEQGFHVFRASTGCYGGKKVETSTQILHGEQLQNMFCFDHEHPHCLAGISKPQILLKSATEFIEQRQLERQRWAVFLTLPEGTEETETLVDSLDIPLTIFLSKLSRTTLSHDQWLRTVIAIYSGDSHSGPVLIAKLGSNSTATTINDTSRRLPNFLTNLATSNVTILNGIPFPEAVEYGKMSVFHLSHENSTIVNEETPPPSVLSFYADVPKAHKTKIQTNRPTKSPPQRAKVRPGCRCATNVQTWFECNDQHPWNAKEDFREYFMLVDCPNNPTHLELQILPNKVLLNRSKNKRKESGYGNASNVNILFLEIDSVSQAYADRHFPITRDLLSRYRLKKNPKNGKISCPFGMCSADFSRVTLAGANSIPNQVAALAGCLSSSTNSLCGLSNSSKGEICNDASQPHYGMRLERVRVAGEQAYWCPMRDDKKVKTPWLFGVTDARGYINFFGEEFCYESSPYVTQGNVFTRFYQDIESHHVFCRLAERILARENQTIARDERWGVVLEGPCIDGSECLKNTEKSTISLQLIQRMWGIYQDTPKFAFFNAIAAHDYSHHWERVTAKSERYDEHLAQFLEGMLSRKDSDQTVIILRSDHGLQRGPMAMDYSLQVEHRRPWTEMLVPESLIPSKRAFYENQNRMTTGFDLYTTMRGLISRSKGSPDEEGIPRDWSYDLLSEEVPLNRSCVEAQVDLELCRTRSVPREYGTCNHLDLKQKKFCVT